MDRDTRKAIGQFYTPDSVIESILKNTVEEADVLENPFVTVVDISCGSGHFLIMAYDILKRKFKNSLEELKIKYANNNYLVKRDGNEKEVSGKEYWVKENIHYHVLKHCLYGSDIDSFAIQLTTINLLLKDLDNFTDQINIIECDSLIKYEEDYNWRDLKKQLNQEFEVVKSKHLNIFGEEEIIETTIRKENYNLKYKNKMGYEVEEKINRNEAQKIVALGEFWNRRYDYVLGNPPYIRYEKIDEKTINYIKNKYETAYKFFDVFSIFIERSFEICKYNKYISLITPNLYIKGLDYRNLRKYILENSKDIKVNDLGDNIFNDVQMPTAIIKIHKDKRKTLEGDTFNILEDNSIINKIKNNKKLEEISEIQRGLEFGKNILCDKKYKNTFEVLSGEDIDRYSIKSKKYIEEKFLIGNNKDNKYFTEERVLIRETGDRITTVYVNKKIYSLRSLYSIIPKKDIINAQALSGILNSNLIQYFYFTQFKSNTEIFPKIRIGQVRQIPICIRDKKLLNMIQEKVSKIEDIKKSLLKTHKKIEDILMKQDDHNQKIVNLVELLDENDKNIVALIDLERDMNDFVYQLYDINKKSQKKIHEELKIQTYDSDLNRAKKLLSIAEFLDSIKELTINQISEKYKCSQKDIIKLRDENINSYSEIQLWKFYNTESVNNTIYSIVEDTMKNILNNNKQHTNYKKTKEDISKRLQNFEELIDIIRLDYTTITILDIIKKSLNINCYTWNAYRKAKNKDRVNKIFIKYYDSNYYGLSEWSDEIHKHYFLDAIEEYTETDPNEKKAKDILKLFKDLDIEDKKDYLSVIEGKISRVFK